MKHVLLIIAFLMMISSSKNSRAQATKDVVFNRSDPTVTLKGISPRKKKFKSKSATGILGLNLEYEVYSIPLMIRKTGATV